MILQNTNFRFNFFRIASFDSRVCCLGEPRKKICWLSQQRTEKSIFRVIFRIGFDVINAMILQNTISRFTLLKFSLYLSFQVFSMCIELYVCIMLSLASLVPISSHINNSPLSSTYGDMTLLYSLTFISKILALTVNGYPPPALNVSPKQSDSSLAHFGVQQ